MNKPNVLLAMTDQQNYSILSCAENPWVSTPHPDGLAAVGARREQFFDRATNPGQMFNQLEDPRYAARVEKARRYLKGRV